jgi:acyl-coenzyme A synthetase/AMP-(fatty) acid ligase
MSVTPLVWRGDLDAPIAWRDGRPISRRQYLADVARLAARLPEASAMLNLTGDRYRFAVVFGAAMLRGQISLLPPNHTSDMIERLRALHPTVYAITDSPSIDGALKLKRVEFPTGHADLPHDTVVPEIDDAAQVVQVLTSGSTGTPVPHAKPWGLLCRGARAEAERLSREMGLRAMDGVTVVSTVPAQHMYGFESTVLLALQSGCAVDIERPFYPADVSAALARAGRPCLLVTTPYHLKSTLDSGIALPAIDLTLCATAPLSPQTAARAEAALAAPLIEIYGSTETGQVATRRTTAGPEWRAFEGVTVSGDGDATVAQGGHVPQPTVLADIIEVLSPASFRLLGRSNDMINVAGKRSSLGHLNYHLNSIEGVVDGAFWLPPDLPPDGVVRLVAFVVAPEVEPQALTRRVVAAMRERVDAAFLPRRVVAVEALPRVDATGKLPVAAFAAWAERTLAAAGPRSA